MTTRSVDVCLCLHASLGGAVWRQITRLIMVLTRDGSKGTSLSTSLHSHEPRIALKNSQEVAIPQQKREAIRLRHRLLNFTSFPRF